MAQYRLLENGWSFAPEKSLLQFLNPIQSPAERAKIFGDMIERTAHTVYEANPQVEWARYQFDTIKEDDERRRTVAPNRPSGVNVVAQQARTAANIERVINPGPKHQPQTTGISPMATPVLDPHFVDPYGAGVPPFDASRLPTFNGEYDARFLDPWGPGTQPKATGLGKVFSDPNIQSLLTNIGAGLDPEGPGGAIGRAGTSMIRSNAAQKLAGTMDQQRTAWNAAMLQKYGPITPKDQEGPDNISFNAEGGSVKFARPLDQRPGAPTAGEGQETYASAPSSTASAYTTEPTTTTTPTLSNPKMPKYNMSAVFPFSSARVV